MEVEQSIQLRKIAKTTLAKVQKDLKQLAKLKWNIHANTRILYNVKKINNPWFLDDTHQVTLVLSPDHSNWPQRQLKMSLRVLKIRLCSICWMKSPINLIGIHGQIVWIKVIKNMYRYGSCWQFLFLWSAYSYIRFIFILIIPFT